MKNIFAIYKPKGPSSNQILGKIKFIIKQKNNKPRQKNEPKKIKVGHAGTLDPLAEGVLVVAIGREYTKQLGKILDKEKEYIADIKLGETSVTDDAEGKDIALQHSNVTKKATSCIDVCQIKKILPKFIGNIKQVPPIYSATKMGGKKAYELARQGKDVKLGAGQVEIKKIEILQYKYPDLKLRVVCGSGVYIRSLARDIGEELGVGGYLVGLVRTRVGEFTIEDAIREEDFEEYLQSDKISVI